MNLSLAAMLSALALTRPLAGAGSTPDPAETLAKTHTAPADQYSGKDEMFGHTFSSFGEFYKTWKMVTVRYRQDTHEQRFVWANDIAWKALQAGGTKYPDGAVFAKIGFITAEDKSFASSLVPSGAKRYQFMVRDARKFRDTDGWGYMLFNGKGKTFPGEPVLAAKACAACHRVVADRSYVFSQPVQVEPFLGERASTDAATKPAPPSLRLTFKNVAARDLPWEMRSTLPSGTKHVRSLQGEMRANLFEGTLNEIRPLLAGETMRSGQASALISEDGQQFSFTFRSPESSGCPAGQVNMSYGMTVLSPTFIKTSGGAESEKVMKLGRYCFRPPNP